VADLAHRPPAAVCVVAPHPDDETLALGAALYRWAAAGVPIEVVAVTDGEGSHPGHPGLAAARIAEQHVALGRLGVAGRPTRLGLPDGAVADHEDAAADALASLLRPGTVLLAPWAHDGHPDHDVVGRAARRAAAARDVELREFPVWAYHGVTPAALAGLGAARLPAGPEAVRAKVEAVAAFRTQLEALDGAPPILGAAALALVDRPAEVIFARPR